MRRVLLLLFLVACDPEVVTEPDWRLAGSDPDAAFMSVGGTSASDVWVVGAADDEGGLIVHNDGERWARVPNSDPHDLWWVHAFGDVVYAAGAGGTVLRGDADGFVRVATPGLGAHTLYGLWGASEAELWAVGGFAGRDGFVWRYQDGAWGEVALPDDVPRGEDGAAPALFKVWGAADDDVWFVGTAGTVLHWDGSALSVVPSGTDELLFTVHGEGDQVAIVGPDTVLVGGHDGLSADTPDGASILQGVRVEPDGTIVVTGASGTVFTRAPDGVWTQAVNTTGVTPESLHAVWTDPDGGRWAVGGGVLSASLDAGVIQYQGAAELPSYLLDPVPATEPAACPAEEVDSAPSGSIARRWNEQILWSIRRDIPRPGVHARNLFHVSLAMWDAWAVYDEVADPVSGAARATADDVEAARQIAISHAAYRVLRHRYADQSGGDVSVACYDAFMAQLGLDPTDQHLDGDDAVAVGNRIGAWVIASYADDGANEAENYADTTGWSPVNDPLVVDVAGVEVVDPDEWQPLNLATAETQNGIVLDSGEQGYICPTWGLVQPWALTEPVDGYRWFDLGPPPSVADAEMKDWVAEVLRKHAMHSPDASLTLDISPGAYGNNPLGSNDGLGHEVNPVTGEPYEANVVPLGDFTRVLSEFWADGPKSETPPGHWNVLANEVGDTMEAGGTPLRLGGEGTSLDRLAWDVHLYLALNGALHDAAIAAWGEKRQGLGPRPITLVRWMGQEGQSSDASLPAYDPDGLLLEDGVVELITEESAAEGERHHALRWYIGEVAVYSWRGEPGDRASMTAGVGWMRAKDWFPYQRRTFVTPAFPGFISGHSTFSRAAAEVLTRATGSAFFPGGLASFTADAGAYLVFEDGPSESVTLQWATYADAADQAGQSRVYGGIHIWPDDEAGRRVGAAIGALAYGAAEPWWSGSAR